MKSEWDKGMKLTWGDIISLEYGKPVPDKFQTNGDVPVFGTNGQIGTSNLPPLCSHASTIVGRKGAYRGVHYSNVPFSVIDTAFFVEETTKLTDSKWIYYKLLTLDINRMDSGSAIPSTDRSEIYSLPVTVPPLPAQRKIASILSALDDKIEINNAICRNLEEQAMALFKKRFLSTTVQPVEDKPVYDFAEYINGAAFKQQEYGKTGLPIIKIAELKFGITSSTLMYNGSNKDEKFLIDNGDILFSWSGNPETSIDVFIWTRGKAILNQHIFNVKSRHGAKWFTYLMLKNYMPVFAKIAADKQTTGLGHVTVADLKRLTFTFNLNHILAFEEKVSFYMEQVYNSLIENNTLSILRDTLLPRLMNGELNLDEIEV